MRFLRLLYAPCCSLLSFLYARFSDNACHAAFAVQGEFWMSVMDAISLLMGAGLFVYLLVALLRADRT